MAGRDITHEAQTTSLVSNRALVKEDAHNDGDEQKQCDRERGGGEWGERKGKRGKKGEG